MAPEARHAGQDMAGGSAAAVRKASDARDSKHATAKVPGTACCTSVRSGFSCPVAEAAFA